VPRRLRLQQLALRQSRQLRSSTQARVGGHERRAQVPQRRRRIRLPQSQ
jgi:hypothetical protein